MINAVFGNMMFNIGWKTKVTLKLFDKEYEVIVKAKAYYETDGITTEQEQAFSDFKSNIETRLAGAEAQLNQYAQADAGKRFIPQTLLIQRDGAYALLFDDTEDEDGGVAVTFSPTLQLVSQDEYL